MCRFCHWLWQCWGWWRPRWGCSYQSAEPECQWGSHCVAWRSASGTQTLGMSGTSGAAHTHTPISKLELQAIHTSPYPSFIQSFIHHSYNHSLPHPSAYPSVHKPFHQPVHASKQLHVCHSHNHNAWCINLSIPFLCIHTGSVCCAWCIELTHWICVMCLMYKAYVLGLSNVLDVQHLHTRSVHCAWCIALTH